jgi:hypothetical protein
MLSSLFFLALVQGGASSTTPTPAPLAQDEHPPAEAARVPQLLDHKRLSLAMQRLAGEHTDLVAVLNVGHSREGRMFEGLRIAHGEIAAGRPAILVVANIEGPLVYTSEVAMELARSLVEGYGADERVTRLLDRTTVYVIPRANPDGAEARFLKPLAEVRATGQDVDNDRDGRMGEDPPADVNGDGIIAWMRIPDLEGKWIEDPTDSRATIEADRKKGQRGRYKLVREGRDTDHDEEASEDGPHDAVVNRNFPQDWRDHDAEGGVFATDEPETRALCEFVLSKRDIQLVVVLGELDDIVEKPKSVPDPADRTEGIPAPGILESDAVLLAEIGKRWAKISSAPSKGGTDFAGTFQAWCYAERGLLSVSVNPWTIPLDAAKSDEAKSGEAKPGETKTDEAAKDETKKPAKDEKPEPSDEAKRLAWIDKNPEEGVTRFLPWTPFQHPELGAIDIGGFAPYGTIEPPAARRAELAREQLGLVLALDEMLARVTIEDAHIREIAPGLIEVRAVIVNPSFLPLLTRTARRSRAVRPAKVELFLPKEAMILAGEKQELISDLDGAGGRHELRWLVQGGTVHSIGVSVTTDDAGTARYQETK